MAPALHGVDSRFDGTEGRHDDDRRVSILPLDQPQHFNTAHCGKAEVGEDEVRTVDTREGGFRSAGGIDVEAGRDELQFDDSAELVFVFDYEYARFHIYSHGHKIEEGLAKFGQPRGHPGRGRRNRLPHRRERWTCKGAQAFSPALDESASLSKVCHRRKAQAEACVTS